VAAQLLEAVSEHAVEAAIRATEQAVQADQEVRQALKRELEEAQYEATLAARRYEVVDPAKRLVARELEARWNRALERVAELEGRIARLDTDSASRPKADRTGLMALAHDLRAVWNAPGAEARTKQRLTRILIQEVVLDLDETSNEAIVTIHWTGGRHTELRVARVRTGRYPADRFPSPVEVVRRLGGQWSDREVAVTMNRMRCKSGDGQSWTTARVRELRERLGIAPFDPSASRPETISVEETGSRTRYSAPSTTPPAITRTPSSSPPPSGRWAPLPTASRGTQRDGRRQLLDQQALRLLVERSPGGRAPGGRYGPTPHRAAVLRAPSTGGFRPRPSRNASRHYALHHKVPTPTLS
jgi:hypothetical protein